MLGDRSVSLAFTQYPWWARHIRPHHSPPGGLWWRKLPMFLLPPPWWGRVGERGLNDWDEANDRDRLAGSALVAKVPVFPGIEDGDASGDEFLDVARHHRQSVFRGRGGDQDIRMAESVTTFSP